MSEQTIKAWIDEAIKAVEVGQLKKANFSFKKAKDHFKRLKADKKKAPD